MKITLKRNHIILLALMYLIAWSISPPLSYGNLYRVLGLGMVAVILLFGIGKMNRSTVNTLILCLLLIAYMIIVGVFVKDAFTLRIQFYIFMAILLCGLVLEDLNDADTFKILLLYIMVLFIIWNITSLIGIRSKDNVMRLMAKNGDYSERYSRQGIGGYGYVYAVLLMFPIGLDLALRKNERFIRRLIAWIFVGTTFFLIIGSSYFMALLLMILTVPLFFVLKTRKKTVRIVALLVFIAAAVLVFLFSEQILSIMYSLIPIRELRIKISGMIQLLNEDQNIAESQFGTRYERYTRSLMYMLQHPLLGGFSYSVTGKHSFLLDFGAQYGIPALLLLLGMFRKPFQKLAIRGNNAISCAIILAAIVLFTNAIAFSMASVLFLILPIYAQMIEKEELGYEESDADSSLRLARGSGDQLDQQY